MKDGLMRLFCSSSFLVLGPWTRPCVREREVIKAEGCPAQQICARYASPYVETQRAYWSEVRAVKNICT